MCASELARTVRILDEESGSIVDYYIQQREPQQELAGGAADQSHEVYVAREDVVPRRRAAYALKLHRESAIPDRVQAEACVLRQLRGIHGVPQLVACGYVHPEHYVGSLALAEARYAVVTKWQDCDPCLEDSLSGPRSTEYIRHLARILRAVHAKGVFHGNLSSRNLYQMRSGNNMPFLTGFGRTGPIGDPHDDRERTGESGRWLPVGERRCRESDLFSFAVIAYELLTGSPLFVDGRAAAARIDGSRTCEEVEFRRLEAPQLWLSSLARRAADRTDALLEHFASVGLGVTKSTVGTDVAPSGTLTLRVDSSHDVKPPTAPSECAALEPGKVDAETTGGSRATTPAEKTSFKRQDISPRPRNLREAAALKQTDRRDSSVAPRTSAAFEIDLDGIANGRRAIGLSLELAENDVVVCSEDQQTWRLETSGAFRFCNESEHLRKSIVISNDGNESTVRATVGSASILLGVKRSGNRLNFAFRRLT